MTVQLTGLSGLSAQNVWEPGQDTVTLTSADSCVTTSQQQSQTSVDHVAPQVLSLLKILHDYIYILVCTL